MLDSCLPGFCAFDLVDLALALNGHSSLPRDKQRAASLYDFPLYIKEEKGDWVPLDVYTFWPVWTEMACYMS